MSEYEKVARGEMRIEVHPRVHSRHPDISDADVVHAFEHALRSRPRDTDPIHWVGVGADPGGRLLEFIAVEVDSDGWLVFHSMKATSKVLIELGLGR